MSLPLPTNRTEVVTSPPSESLSSLSIGVLSSGSERGGGIARGDRLADAEGFVDDVESAGAESPSKSATPDRDVVGAFGGAVSPDTES